MVTTTKKNLFSCCVILAVALGGGYAYAELPAIPACDQKYAQDEDYCDKVYSGKEIRRNCFEQAKRDYLDCVFFTLWLMYFSTPEPADPTSR